MKANTYAGIALLALIGAASSAPALAGPSHAALDIPPTLERAQAGYYHFMVGKVNVSSLSDGTLSLEPQQLLTNTTARQVADRLSDGFQNRAVDISVNAYLIETAGRRILVDAGTGTLFGPTLNKLPASLGAMGISPAQITDILVTHIHADHTGGLTDVRGMVFPNATLHVAQQELDYWMSASQRTQAAPAKRKGFDDARKAMQPYLDAGRIKTFQGPTQLFPGIRTIPSPGHTPGHTFYALESEGQKLVFWGDLFHIAEVQLPHPEVTISFDVDPEAARRQRRQAFIDAAAGRYMVAPAHVSFPGTGHIRAEGKGFRWVPTTYRNDYVPRTATPQ
jgi:glyoxylase-like metal-dependent hydrolase (beta-lactamase superfamily II)